MYRLAEVQAGQRVIDPSCGDGSFLRAAPAGLDLFGCEMDPQYTEEGALLVAAGNFVAGDALTQLRKLEGTCDLAIGNPPFSAQSSLEKRPEVLRKYALAGRRRAQCLEILFIELFVKLVKEGGHIAVILPDGPLSNKPYHYVREWLLAHTEVRAIISLPRGIFSGTQAKTNIVFARRRVFSLVPTKSPTYFFECKSLSDLRMLGLNEWVKQDARWQSGVLTSADWRPEARDASDGNVTQSSFSTEATEAAEGTLRLGDHFKLRTGYALYGAKRELFDAPSKDRTLLLRAKNIDPKGGLRLQENCAYLASGGEMFCEQSLVRAGEIVFVRVGVGCYGRTALMPSGVVAQADDWIHILTPVRPLDSARLVEWFNSEKGRTTVRKLAKGVGTLSVSKVSLADLRIPAWLGSGTNELAPSGAD